MKKPKFEADRLYIRHQTTMYAMAQKRVMSIQTGVVHGLPFISDKTKALFIDAQMKLAELKASIYGDYKKWKEIQLESIETIETDDGGTAADTDAVSPSKSSGETTGS